VIVKNLVMGKIFLAVPSSQIAASWVKAEIVSVDWVALTDLCFVTIRKFWSGRSENEIWDYVEQNIGYVAEHLREEVANCHIDGSARKFEIDDEQPPYVRAIGTETSPLLKHLRSIDPFKVEEICADILKALGAEAKVTQRTADGGVDFIATNLHFVPNNLTIPTACKAAIIGQTKRYKVGNVITERQMREFVGSGILKKHILQNEGKIGPLTPILFAFWTTSDFEPNAKKYAREVGLWFMDGHTLATYIQSLQMADAIMALPPWMVDLGAL
jgi:restriction endonuclease Mrr